MDAIATALDEVAAALQRFGAAPELRVLHVTTSAELRLGALARIVAAEGRAGNTRPFFALEAPVEPDDDGWETRREELRADHERLLAEAAENGVTLRPLPPADANGAGLVGFARDAADVADSLRPPLDGLVLVLAPVWVRDDERWQADLTALLAPGLLDQLRVIIVDVEKPLAAAVARDLGEAALLVDARVDDAALGADVDKILAAMSAAPPAAAGPRLVGGAGPREAPPPRRRAGQPAPAPGGGGAALAATATESGVSRALLTPEVPHAIRVLVLEAAQAMRKGDAAGALRKQREARDLCAANHLGRETVVMELVLGGHALQAGEAAAAAEVFGDARERATAEKLPDLAAQAELARGSALLVGGDGDAAAVAYAEAGALAAAAGMAVLAIEGFRMAGQLLLARGQERQAIAAWTRALAVADAAPAEQRAASTAAEAARALAAVCRRHDLTVQARALDEQAAAYETAAPAGTA